MLKRNLLLTLGVLVTLNLLVAVAAIGLFGRMGPAIAKIMRENERSIEAGEQMLFVLAEAGGQNVGAAARGRFKAALERARANVTDRGELPVLDRLTTSSPAALSGDAAARRQLLTDLQTLIVINRRAMATGDGEARRLGRAGAWGAVFLGFFSLLLALVVLRRFERSVVAPLVEIHDVLSNAHSGDPHRRCQELEGLSELRQMAALVNELLDRSLPADLDALLSAELPEEK